MPILDAIPDWPLYLATALAALGILYMTLGELIRWRICRGLDRLDDSRTRGECARNLKQAKEADDGEVSR